MLTSLISSCTIMKIGDGATVRVVAEPDVQQCRRLRRVQVQVDAGSEDIAFEVLAKAKASAARIGGDTVVEQGAMTGGRQDYVVYRCQPLSTREDPSVIGVEIEKTI